MRMGIHKKIIEAVINLNKSFIDNHQLKLNLNKDRIGRSNSVSHIFEREIAKKLAEVYPNFLFLVDYPISLLDKNDNILTGNNNKNVPPIYPDILVVKDIKVIKDDDDNYSVDNNNGQVIALLDLKIDLGYLDLNYYAKYDKKKVNFAYRNSKINQADKCRFNYIVGAYSKDEKKINKDIGKLYATLPTVATDLKKISIVCTKENSHGRENVFKSKMEECGYNVIFLLEKCHPNTIEDITKKINNEIEKKKKSINKVFAF